MFGGDRLAVVELECVRVAEPGRATDQFEAAVLQLAAPVAGEFLDHRRLAPHHCREVEADLARLQAPDAGAPGLVPHIGRVQQRLGRHAAAQDAQSAQFPAALDNDGATTAAGGRPCGGVAGAAAADHRNLEVVFPHVAWPRCNGERAKREELTFFSLSSSQSAHRRN